MTSPLRALSHPPTLLEPGPSWAIFGALGAISARFGKQSGPSRAVWAAFWAFLELPWAVLGGSRGPYSVYLPPALPAPPGVALGLPEGPLGQSWTLWGPFWPFWAAIGAILDCLGGFLGPLGALLGRPGPLWKPCWAFFGVHEALLGRSGLLLDPPWAVLQLDVALLTSPLGFLSRPAPPAGAGARLACTCHPRPSRPPWSRAGPP